MVAACLEGQCHFIDGNTVERAEETASTGHHMGQVGEATSNISSRRESSSGVKRSSKR
jgi:hypothetical protein